MADIGKIKYDEKKRKNRAKMGRIDSSVKEIAMVHPALPPISRRSESKRKSSSGKVTS